MKTVIQDITIGTKFIRYGRKNKHVEMVYDIFRTYNNAGELVKTEYGVQHVFMGQIVKDTVPAVTIQRSIWENGEIQ